MAPGIRAIFPPATERNSAPRSGLAGLIKDSFTLSTLLVLGSLGQAALSLILPSRYALLPLVFLFGRAVVVTARELAFPAEYASKRGIIPGRTAAHIPYTSYDPQGSEKTSPFSSTPAEKGVVVLHLGARYNHPLGVRSPGGKAFTDQFLACHKDLLEQAKVYGCLGGTTWRADEASSNNTIMGIYYFRDMEGLNRFAHDPLHRQAWNWYNGQFVKKWGYSHIGIFHEAFWAPAGAYETIYINMPPVLMAGGNASVKNEATGKDEWVRTVVDGSTPAWRNQYSRMGKEGKEVEA